VHGAHERRRFSQTMASEWQTAFVVSHKMPWCALLTAVKNYNKIKMSWKTARLFLQNRDKDQDWYFMIQDQDQDFHFCSRGASRPRPWSRGLHHWILSRSEAGALFVRGVWFEQFLCRSLWVDFDAVLIFFRRDWAFRWFR